MLWFAPRAATHNPVAPSHCNDRGRLLLRSLNTLEARLQSTPATTVAREFSFLSVRFFSFLGPAPSPEGRDARRAPSPVPQAQVQAFTAALRTPYGVDTHELQRCMHAWQEADLGPIPTLAKANKHSSQHRRGKLAVRRGGNSIDEPGRKP